MEKELISVIVPIYNVENYLKRCVDSIIYQSYKNLQIILVDDGSTDLSKLICDDYLKIDKRINVIHKKNGGLSEARNAGIDVAIGKFITFIDGDDWVHEQYIEHLFKSLQIYKAEISECSIVEYDKKRHYADKSVKYFEYDGVEAIEKMCYQKEIRTSVTAKLYYKELFKNVRFPVGRIYEDLGTTYKLLSRVKRIVRSTKQYYFYCKRDDSITHQPFNHKKMDRIINSEELLLFLDDNFPDLIDAAITRNFISNIQVLKDMPLGNIENLDDQNRIKANIRKFRFEVLRNKKAKAITRCIAFSSYFPLLFMKKLYFLYELYKKYFNKD